MQLIINPFVTALIYFPVPIYWNFTNKLVEDTCDAAELSRSNASASCFFSCAISFLFTSVTVFSPFTSVIRPENRNLPRNSLKDVCHELLN